MAKSPRTAQQEEILKKYQAMKAKLDKTRQEIQAIKEEELQRLVKLMAAEQQIRRSDCADDSCDLLEPDDQEPD